MKRLRFLLIAVLVCLMMVDAEGRRGGGGRGGGGRGGGGRSRSAGRSPSFSRSSSSRSYRSSPSRSYRSSPSRSYSSAARSTQRYSSASSRTPSFSRSTSQYRGSTAYSRYGGGGGGYNRSGSAGYNRYAGGGTGYSRYRDGGYNRSVGAGNRPSSRDLGNFLNMPTQGGASGFVGNRPGAAAGLAGAAGAAGLAGFGGVGGPGRPGGAGGIGGVGGVGRPGGVGGVGGVGGPGGVGGVGGVGGNRPSQLPARGDRTGWNNYHNTRASSVRNLTQNNINYNRYGNRPGGWWGGGYGRGFAHGWSASNAWRNWGGYWGWHGWPSGYWWGVGASVAGLTAWGASSLFADHSEPIYYDYGDTVYIDNGEVYRDGTALASEEEYASQAIEYANVPVPSPPEVSDPGSETPEEDAAMQEFADDWMPLGVFAVASEKEGVEPSYYLQLAVSKEGYIAGTLYNSIKDETLPVTGSVDKQSQRAAWKLADNPDVVMESGIFDLTKDTATALLHFGKDKTETRLLVQMEKPEQQKYEY